MKKNLRNIAGDSGIGQKLTLTIFRWVDGTLQ